MMKGNHEQDSRKAIRPRVGLRRRKLPVGVHIPIPWNDGMVLYISISKKASSHYSVSMSSLAAPTEVLSSAFPNALLVVTKRHHFSK